MARTDRSAVRTPNIFIAIAVCLVVARAGLAAASATVHRESQPTAWKTATEADKDILPGTQDIVEPEETAVIRRNKAPVAPPKPVFEKIPLSDEDKEAVAAGKLVLYEFVSDWSDPCKHMEETALSNRQVSRLIETSFVPVRITDQIREQGKNPKWIANLQKRYHIFALPTLVVVDSKGDAVAQLIGNCSSLTVQRFLARSLSKAGS